MDAAEFERNVGLLQACWAYFDGVAARVSAEMRKGRRGGGRDRDTIVRHTIRNESEYFARMVGLVIPEHGALGPALTPYRTEYVGAMRAYQRGEIKERCGRGHWPTWCAIPPSTRWTTRGRWRIRTCPTRACS
jgi:hypothetical protein